MNFDYSPKVQELREKLARFMAEHVYPNEHKWRAHVRSKNRWEVVPIIEELKPLVDRTYRSDPARTGLAGSSLGGLVSLHLGFTHPAVFTRIAALSPSVWWDRKAILKTVRQARSKPKLRLWVDMGTAEGRRGLDDARLLKAALVGLGFVDGVDLHYAEYEGATHSEQAWSERVAPMLEWLFPVGA